MLLFNISETRLAEEPDEAPDVDDWTVVANGMRVLNRKVGGDGSPFEPCILDKEVCADLINENLEASGGSGEERDHREYVNAVLPWLVGAKFLRTR